MTRMLLAGVLSTLLTMSLGPWFIAWLRRNEFGQQFREDGPQAHAAAKAGTPTMGGLLILVAMTPAYFAIVTVGRGNFTAFGFVVWTTMMACALIGFWDDWMKISNRRSLGLSGRGKMFLLACVTAFLGWSSHALLLADTVLEVPFANVTLDLGWGYYIFIFFVLAGASNCVNLTDGLDGLAAGTVVISLMSFMAIAFIIWERQLQKTSEVLAPLGPLGSLDIAVFCAALAGACVGFLWFNAFPAKVFMGDTGSMALGGALAALAVVLKTELLLVVIGGIFVVEGLSVILQVLFFKWKNGMRLFLMAPIHHHFELRAWSETQIMLRFWIVAGLFAATGFTVWFRSH